MANKILVIEIDQVTTRVVEMDYVSKKPNVYSFFTMPTPSETTRDGSVRVNEDFIMEFKNNLSLHNMNSTQCLFLLSSSRIISRNHIIPYVKTSQIQGVIDGMFTEFFPVDPQAYHSKYEIIEVRKDDNEIELNVLAIPNELTLGYFEVAKSLNLEIVDIKYIGRVSLDYNRLLDGKSIYDSELLHSLPDYIVNAVDVIKRTKKSKTSTENEKTNSGRDDGAVVLGVDQSDNDVPLKAVVKLEAYSSFVTIIKNDDVVFDRCVSMGYSNIIEYVQSQPDFGEELSMQKALKVLYNNTLLTRTFDEYVNPADPLETHKNIISGDIEIVVEAISRAIEYYTSKNEGEYISTMYLTGSGAGIKGISRLMQNELGYNIQVLDSFPDLNFVLGKNDIVVKEVQQGTDTEEATEENKPSETGDNQVFSLDDLSKLSNVIQNNETQLNLDLDEDEESFNVHIFALLITSGLAYGGIVSEEERFGDAAMAQNRKDKNTTMLCLMCSGLLLLVTLFLVFFSIFQYNAAINKQKKLKKQISNYEAMKVEETYNEYNCEVSITSELKNILSYTHSNNEKLTAFIKELENKIPSETVVLSIVANDNGITLDFESPDKESAAKLIMQLRTFECIDLVSSENLTDSATYSEKQFLEEDGSRVVSYSVSLTYKDVPYDADAFLNEALGDLSKEG